MQKHDVEHLKKPYHLQAFTLPFKLENMMKMEKSSLFFWPDASLLVVFLALLLYRGGDRLDLLTIMSFPLHFDVFV